jgi:hypothetical protein
MSTNNNIKFQAIGNLTYSGFKPSPAYMHIPDWWKNISPHTSISGVNSVPTVKQCPPTIDAFSSGYLIFTQCDMFFNEEGFFEYSYPEKIVERWYKGQTDGLMFQEGYSEYVYKFINRWIVKTPKGWSSLFIHPPAYPDLPFTTLTGIVDTDKLNTDINPPFRMKSGWTGIIKAGTPIAQIIPVKRSEWTSSIEKISEEEFLENQNNLKSGGYGKYLKTMRERKVYR